MQGFVSWMSQRLVALSVGPIVTAGVALAGCESAPRQSGPVLGGSGNASLSIRQDAAASEHVRVQSIQRVAPTGDETLMAGVSVRNVGPTPCAVTVTVMWLSHGGTSGSAGGDSAQTITLAAQEMRQLTFSGPIGADDFKVSLAYPGG